MNQVDLYVKILTLLVREIELFNISQDESDTSNSKDLIKTVLSVNKNKKASTLQGGESNIYTDLKDLIIDISNNPDSYTKETIINTLNLILKDRKDILEIVTQVINTEMSIAGLKRSIVALRKYLNNYYRDGMITNTITDAAYKLRTDTIEDKSSFVTELITKLESLSIETKGKNEGIVDELDIDDDSSLTNTLKVVKDQAAGTIKLKTGWKKLNEMLSGGFRKGECVIINALQHKYKSGFTQSLFMQVARHNVPVLANKDRKPLIVYISFEDDANVFVEFMYRYLYYNENKQIPDLNEVSAEEITKYIKDKLTVNGYHIKMLRVNPSEWTYKHIINKVLEYEADGYEVHALFVDYLAKLPTTGCITSGPMGTDYRDMWNRLRNFASARNLLLVSPAQLSTQAKQLIKNGVSDSNFVKEVAGKGYTELSAQIDQVVDLELYIHIARIDRKPYLTVQRGKHRTPTILDPEKMFFLLPFPHKAPIPEDINDPDDGTGIDLTSTVEGVDFDF